MVEIKDGYAGFLESDWGKGFLAEIFSEQAMDQIQAAGTRSVRWYFSQKQVADFAKRMFAKTDLQNIEIVFEPWPGSGK
jgi:hypothetical protein